MAATSEMDRIREWLENELREQKDLGTTQRQLAGKLNRSDQWVTGVKNGKINLYADLFMQFVLEFGQIPDFYMEQTRLGIVGKVGAGGNVLTEYENHAEPLFEINVDCMFIEKTCLGFQVDGESMFPVFKHGDIIVAKEKSHDISELIGKEAIVAVEGEGRFLKRIEKSSIEGLYNLESYNAPPMRGKKISWASKVLATLHKGSYRLV